MQMKALFLDEYTLQVTRRGRSSRIMRTFIRAWPNAALPQYAAAAVHPMKDV